MPEDQVLKYKINIFDSLLTANRAKWKHYILKNKSNNITLDLMLFA